MSGGLLAEMWDFGAALGRGMAEEKGKMAAMTKIVDLPKEMAGVSMETADDTGTIIAEMRDLAAAIAKMGEYWRP
jgi:hypothetical protein